MFYIYPSGYGSSRLFVRKRTRQMDRTLYLSLLIIVEGLFYGMIIWLTCAKLWGKGVSSTFPGLWCLWRHQDPLADPLRVLLACGILWDHLWSIGMFHFLAVWLISSSLCRRQSYAEVFEILGIPPSCGHISRIVGKIQNSYRIAIELGVP